MSCTSQCRALGADPKRPERPASDEFVDEGSAHSEVVGHLVKGQQSLVHKRVHKRKRLRGLVEHF